VRASTPPTAASTSVTAARGEIALLRAIEGYEVEMLRHGFEAIRAAQAEGPGIPPRVRQ
jgi:hypothetical protein